MGGVPTICLASLFSGARGWCLPLLPVPFYQVTLQSPAFPTKEGLSLDPLSRAGAEDEERHGPRRGEQVVLPWPS